MDNINSYLLRRFSHFSRLFFIFSDNKLLFQFLVFAVIDGISGNFQFLGTQVYFKDAKCALLDDASGSQVQSWQAFPLRLFFQ